MSRWERYISKEIAVEFKACVYFFVFLFFYCVVQMVNGDSKASILVMAEMVAANYLMGYVQVLLMDNFDEADRIGLKEIIYMFICSGIYSGIAYIFQWFERSLFVSLIFLVYLMVAYLSMRFVYKWKRALDTKALNHMLEEFKKNEGSR